MRTTGTFVCAAILFAAALGLALLPPRASSQLPQEEPVPAFHNQAPQGELPATLAPAQFTNIVVQNSYILAARVKKILYQQPCYCHCDRSLATPACSIASPAGMAPVATYACAKRFIRTSNRARARPPSRSAPESNTTNGGKWI